MIRSVRTVAMLAFAFPAFAQAPPPADSPPLVAAPTTPMPASPGPNLAVAAVKSTGGWRASKVIGQTVYNKGNESVGRIDDLIIKDDDKVVMTIISVGGFLGLGGKLVAIPYPELVVEKRQDGTRLTLPNGNAEVLKAAPDFRYEE